jgi:Protein of unknown function (DUF3094)
MPELYPEDQARVDQVINRGIYRVERKPFRPWLLLTILVGVLVMVSVIGYVIAVSFDVL